MPRTAPRRRHPISRRSTLLLRLVGFRYSRTRDAYVLRVIGNRHGPVFKPVPWQSSPLRQV